MRPRDGLAFGPGTGAAVGATSGAEPPCSFGDWAAGGAAGYVFEGIALRVRLRGALRRGLLLVAHRGALAGGGRGGSLGFHGGFFACHASEYAPARVEHTREKAH